MDVWESTVAMQPTCKRHARQREIFTRQAKLTMAKSRDEASGEQLYSAGIVQHGEQAGDFRGISTHPSSAMYVEYAAVSPR